MTNAKTDDATAHPAAFRFRTGALADLSHCVPLLPAAFRMDASVRRKLVTIWSQLLASEARTFCVIEDIERKFPANIEGFGLSAFVSDAFAEEICAAPQPYVSALLYERMLERDGDILLSADQIAKANATTGLNVVVLHFGLRNHDLSDPRSAQTVMAGSAGFYFFHGGYRINMLINEVYGAQAAQFMEHGGLRLVKDFQRESPGAFDGVPPKDYPFFFLLRREWVKPGAVNPMSQLFFSPPARLFLSAAERRMLERALLNEPDAQIAKNLGISIDRIKKTWRNIFTRVGNAAPYLIPAGDRDRSGARGQEKRRHLLDYLRTHLEEIRPSTPSTGANGTS